MTTAVPFIDLSRLTKLLRADVLQDWTAVYDACQFVGGPRVAELEKQLNAILGVPRTIACANGTDAILLGLQAMGVGPGSKVALPNMTFWATYEAIAQLGATPVLIDIDPTDLQMSFEQFVDAHKAHKFTHGILVHLFGWASARLADFRAYCAEHKIRLLEDGAQCFGVRVNGEPVLARADVSTTSFYPAKVVGGAMDGGAIFTTSKEDEDAIRSLANHGRSQHYSYGRIGWNSRMGGVQAAFLLRVLAMADTIVTQRRAAAERYRARLSNKSSKLKLHGPPAGISENGYLAVFTLEGADAEAVSAALKAKSIGCGRTYPETMDQQPPATGAIRHGELRVSQAFCKSVINLPLFFGITDDEIDRSADALLEAIR
jgi:dTDP-4-amino-4,6-dideoxygalactose transaminase